MNPATLRDGQLSVVSRAGSVADSGSASNIDRRQRYCFVAKERSLGAMVGGDPTPPPPMAYGDTVAVDLFVGRGAILR